MLAVAAPGSEKESSKLYWAYGHLRSFRRTRLGEPSARLEILLCV